MKSVSFVKVLLGTAAIAAATLAYAITASEARQMPLGSWPTKLQCIKNGQGGYTGYREEAIGTSDQGELVRAYPDPQCQ